MIKKILLTFLGLLLALLLIGAFLTTHYEVSRSVVIHAPPEKIFPLLGDLKNWPAWEPFSRDNDGMQVTLGEKTSGVGASQSWQGKGNNGRLAFTEWDPTTGIAFDVIFTNNANDSLAKNWMQLRPGPDSSVELSWRIEGDLNMPLIGGYFARLSDKRLGPMFEHGLNRLKAKAEEK